MPRPWGGLSWVGTPHVQQILRALGTGEVPLTHDGLSTLSPWRSVTHVRDLLMHSGVLPHRDRHLLLFQRWLGEWLDNIEDPDHRRLLHRFATWQLLRRLRATAATQPLGPTVLTYRSHHAHPGSRVLNLARHAGPRHRPVHADRHRRLVCGVS
jgi:hypothetical protein